MRSIAILNQKGGVGKTTTAVNLGAALAELGQRVCLIDLDPQAHASRHLGVALGEKHPSIYQVLTGETRLSEVRVAIAARLWRVPSHLDLAAGDMELPGGVGRAGHFPDKLVAGGQPVDFRSRVVPSCRTDSC